MRQGSVIGRPKCSGQGRGQIYPRRRASRLPRHASITAFGAAVVCWVDEQGQRTSRRARSKLYARLQAATTRRLSPETNLRPERLRDRPGIDEKTLRGDFIEPRPVRRRCALPHIRRRPMCHFFRGNERCGRRYTPVPVPAIDAAAWHRHRGSHDAARRLDAVLASESRTWCAIARRRDRTVAGNRDRYKGRKGESSTDSVARAPSRRIKQAWCWHRPDAKGHRGARCIAAIGVIEGPRGRHELGRQLFGAARGAAAGGQVARVEKSGGVTAAYSKPEKLPNGDRGRNTGKVCWRGQRRRHEIARTSSAWCGLQNFE